ncbi:MAG: DUF6261 family protein [Mediterranea sp.]|jgi:hypothetical protein|nr:DUF6261 family protein [Mediterranea sp.]
MVKRIIQIFYYQRLKLSDFFELSHLILERAITVIIAQTLGITKAYNEAMEQLNTLVDIFQRNPALLQTEKLVEAIAKLRRKMVALKTMLKGILIDSEGEQLDNAKIIENIARPYLKSAHNDTQSTLVIRGSELADVLRNSQNLPKLTKLGLKSIVEEIATASKEADDLLYARGEEIAYRKALGSAGKTRDKLEKQIRFLLYTTIPAHYAEATGAQLSAFEQTIMNINGTLDSFRHLTGGGSSDWGGEGEAEDDQENEPDTQPADPPSPGPGPDWSDPDA